MNMATKALPKAKQGDGSENEPRVQSAPKGALSAAAKRFPLLKPS
jgi:hypothetical protein